jgi:AcrR family transcriptional regulator
MVKPVPGSKKEQTRERILRAAARAIRKHGYEGVGVADVMKEAGLTHGGFYAHCASRAALLAAAVGQAGAESTCAIAAAGSEVPRQQADVRRAAARRIKDLIGFVERQFPEWGKSAAHEKAMGVVASMVGALMLARAVDDPQLSKAIRKSARELIRGATG